MIVSGGNGQPEAGVVGPYGGLQPPPARSNSAGMEVQKPCERGGQDAWGGGDLWLK